MDGKQVKNYSNPAGTTKALYEDGQYRVPAGGGGGSLTTITSLANFDFEDENSNVIVTIANANITNANIKTISFIPQETANTSLDDFWLNGLDFKVQNIINNTSFDIVGSALNNASGIYQIKYIINY